MTVTASRKLTRILVLDADTVPALTVTRSLLKKHYVVDVASANSKSRLAPIASFSQGVSACLTYPDPLADERVFLVWLEELLGSQPYDLVIPVTERSLVPLSNHRHLFRNTAVAMADAASLDQVLDKAATFRLAQSLGVAIPHGIYITKITELASCIGELTYPVVIKPSRSIYAGAAGYSKRNVSYASSQASLFRQCEESLHHSPLILQSYFEGVGVGIELIASQGEILYPFQHVRLHEVPLTGGGSSFRMSAEIEPALLAAASKLIRALNWTGVAMVEFKWNPKSNDYCLMEINGRLWGSLPLAVAAGADFPAMLAELALTGRLENYPDYRRKIYCRNLAADLMWHEMVLRAKKDSNSSNINNLNRIPPAKTVLRDLARLVSPRHYFDTQSLRDPMPGLVDIKRLIVNYARRLAGVIAEKRFALEQRLLWRNGTVREKVRAARKVVFICYGNINRSAVAEVVMTSMLPGGCTKLVLSAGFHPIEGRPADLRMQQIATQKGFDLSRSRSSSISDELIHSSDIIFVMEKKHYDDLRAIDPDAAQKTFLLGPGSGESGSGSTEIADPYNGSEDRYRSCFEQIHQSVASLSQAVWSDHVR